MNPESKNRHNYGIQTYAKEFARNMQNNPSPLEEKMMDFLDEHGIDYVFQKIIYIVKDDGYIDRFFIADFYFPTIKVILETDGKFHKKQMKYDAKRTELITSCYPEIKVLRWEWEDFNNSDRVEELLKELHYDEKSENPPKNPISHKQTGIEPFFFTYINDISNLCHCKIFDVNTRVLWKLMEFAEYNSGRIYMNSDRIKQVLTSCDIGKSSYYRAVNALKDSDVISEDNNTFTVSPKLFWKGDKLTRDRLKLI